MSLCTLPDSRLDDPKGTVMADWPWPDGTMKRIELEPIYCVRCGKPRGYVPCGIFIWVTFLCDGCSLEYGAEDDKALAPDWKFWEDVRQEMTGRFGRTLTQEELFRMGEQGRLGKWLELLERESPVLSAMGRAGAPQKSPIVTPN